LEHGLQRQGLGVAVAVSRAPVVESLNDDAFCGERSCECNLLAVVVQELRMEGGADDETSDDPLLREVCATEQPFIVVGEELDVLAPAGSATKRDIGSPGLGRAMPQSQGEAIWLS
jgi:hypothetical protein